MAACWMTPIVVGVHRERDEAVDFARRQAAIVERGFHGLAGELELGAAGVLRELGLSDAGDDGFVLERRGHGQAPLGSAIFTVPVT
jgi:hypothetical protein